MLVELDGAEVGISFPHRHMERFAGTPINFGVSRVGYGARNANHITTAPVDEMQLLIDLASQQQALQQCLLLVRLEAGDAGDPVDKIDVGLRVFEKVIDIAADAIRGVLEKLSILVLQSRKDGPAGKYDDEYNRADR